MCLYPKLILNKKYLPTKKNGYNPPKLTDERVKYVAVGCGNCIECRKQKANEWKTRLNEELKKGANAYFITLTFTNENLIKLREECKDLDDNTCAILAVRRFLERWRKSTSKSLRHWLITELGHNNTERIHLHGLIFTPYKINNELIEKYWKYGNTYTGKYCNERTINYIIKYVTKIDTDHKGYTAKILCSAGLGNNFVDKDFVKYKYKYKKGETIEYYTLPNGNKAALPIYYRNKIWDEDTREKLWIDRMEKNTIYVNGVECAKIDTEKGHAKYMRVLEEQQRNNITAGYGDASQEWSKKSYQSILKGLIAKRKWQKLRKKRYTYRKLEKYLHL